MELLYACLFLTFLLLLLLFFKHLPPNPKPTSKTPDLPPGPAKLPIIGNLHHLRGRLLHRTLRDLAKAHGAPLMHLQLGEVSLVVVTSKDAARDMLKTHDLNFSSRPQLLAAKVVVYGGTDMLFAPHGEYWRELRKLCVLEVLSAKRVLSFRHFREQEAFNFVQRIRAAGPASVVNLSEMFHSSTNSVIARVAFGSECKDAAAYLKAMKEGLVLAGGFTLPDLFPSVPFLSLVTGIKYKLERVHRKIDRILDAIVEEHKERRAAVAKAGGDEAMAEDNILDVLLNLQAQGDQGNILTTANIKAVIFDIFSAGSGTAASSMTWTMTELMNNPRVMKKAQAEIKEALGGKTAITEADIAGRLSYLKLVIKESLRLHPPAPLLVPRECTETCEVGGYAILAKTRVVFNQWAMGRDPRYWGDDAEEFRPERFEGRSAEYNYKGNGNLEYMPFGAGRRMCPGVDFGMASMELPLAQLLYHFEWRLPEGISEMDMAETSGLGARKKIDLCLHATPRDTY